MIADNYLDPTKMSYASIAKELQDLGCPLPCSYKDYTAQLSYSNHNSSIGPDKIWLRFEMAPLKVNNIDNTSGNKFHVDLGEMIAEIGIALGLLMGMSLLDVLVIVLMSLINIATYIMIHNKSEKASQFLKLFFAVRGGAEFLQQMLSSGKDLTNKNSAADSLKSKRNPLENIKVNSEEKNNESEEPEKEEISDNKDTSEKQEINEPLSKSPEFEGIVGKPGKYGFATKDPLDPRLPEIPEDAEEIADEPEIPEKENQVDEENIKDPETAEELPEKTENQDLDGFPEHAKERKFLYYNIYNLVKWSSIFIILLVVILSGLSSSVDPSGNDIIESLISKSVINGTASNVTAQGKQWNI